MREPGQPIGMEEIEGADRLIRFYPLIWECLDPLAPTAHCQPLIGTIDCQIQQREWVAALLPDNPGAELYTAVISGLDAHLHETADRGCVTAEWDFQRRTAAPGCLQHDSI